MYLGNGEGVAAGQGARRQFQGEWEGAKMTETWQPGDRVRCVEPGPTSLVAGQVYTVEFAAHGGVMVAGHLGVWYTPTRFRKVEETQHA